MSDPRATGSIEEELRRLIPHILGSSEPSPPRKSADLTPARDWSNTLEIIERAAEWSRALDRRRVECEAQIRELTAAIADERRRGEQFLQAAEQRIRAAEAQAAALEKRLLEREAQRQDLVARLAYADREAARAETDAERVDRWLDRLHGSIKGWLAAAQDERKEEQTGTTARRLARG